MEERRKLLDEICELKNQYIDLQNVISEVWNYHPSNPNFINPISLHKKLSDDLEIIERKINILTREINSLN